MEADQFSFHVPSSSRVGKNMPKQGGLSVLLFTMALKDLSFFRSQLLLEEALFFLFFPSFRMMIEEYKTLLGLSYKITSLVAQCLVPENLV